jgi:hypothetical protein
MVLLLLLWCWLISLPEPAAVPICMGAASFTACPNTSSMTRCVVPFSHSHVQLL